jgi:hypothetical protein
LAFASTQLFLFFFFSWGGGGGGGGGARLRLTCWYLLCKPLVSLHASKLVLLILWMFYRVWIFAPRAQGGHAGALSTFSQERKKWVFWTLLMIWSFSDYLFCLSGFGGGCFLPPPCPCDVRRWGLKIKDHVQ